MKKCITLYKLHNKFEGDEPVLNKQRMDKDLSLSITNLQRLTDMKDSVDNKYKGTLDS